MGRTITASVSQSALRHNLQQVRQVAPHSKIMAMVKANGYGHGLRLVAKTLSEADALGVASIEEGLILRQHGILKDIILIEGIFREEELPLVQDNHFILVVHHWAQIQALQNFSNTSNSDKKFKVWLKINTGMNRLGFLPKEFEEAYFRLSHHPQVELIGFMTHFSCADEQDKNTIAQCDLFNKLIGDRKGQKSLANSAGILAWPQSHADWVRPGLMLYGASPFATISASELHLKPAMSLNSEIIAIQSLEKGEKVGYGGTWENTALSKIAIVAIGYGDGYPWHAKNGTPVLVNGQRAMLAGRVSMDMLAVDVSHLKEVKIGDPVMLWGEGLPIEEVASFAGTIPYELFCRFTERVTMKVVS